LQRGKLALRVKERNACLYFERHSFKKHINYLKISVNAAHMNVTHFQDFSKTFGILFGIFFK